MFCRAFGPAVLVLSLAVGLVPGIPWISSPAGAETDGQSLVLDEVETLARARSPRVRIIEQRVQAATAELEAVST